MRERELIELAEKAREKAYAPYSGFRVGAALLCRSGEIYLGCNIENASYGATNCAERTAFFQAVSKGEREFEAIAIVGGKDEDAYSRKPCMPCGICLQVMEEFCDPLSFRIFLQNEQKEILSYHLVEMLPHGFALKD